MHRLLSITAAVALTIAPLAVTPSVGAATPPTLTGPTVAGYYDSVVLNGTTPLPSEQVDVYAKGASTGATYAVVRHLTSDGAGHFTVSFRETTTITLYARAGGTNSATHMTQLRTATCTVSKPAFTKLPITDPAADAEFPDFAAFTANRGSTWAGVSVSVSGARFGIIQYTAGHSAKLLFAFRRYNGSYEPAAPGSVYVSAITPHGYLSVTVQEVQTSLEDDRFAAYTYRSGALHSVARSGAWQSIHLVGVGASGHLVGWVRAGTVANPKFAVVEWWETGTHYHYLTAYQTTEPFPIVDPAGDVSYLRDDGYYVVRVAETGRLYPIPALPRPADGNVFPTVAAPTGRVLYGTSDGQLAHWTIGPAGVSAPTQLSAALSGKNTHWASLAGPGGELVDGYFGSSPNPQHLLTANRAYVQVPLQVNADSAVSGRPGSVLDASGTLAFTAGGDHLPHFLSCR